MWSATEIYAIVINIIDISQYFNEIMPAIYRRFTEKESKQWRQIYKVRDDKEKKIRMV